MSEPATHCPTHGVCPPCREGWGHYTTGVGYSPTIESERVRATYAGRTSPGASERSGDHDEER